MLNVFAKKPVRTGADNFDPIAQQYAAAAGRGTTPRGSAATATGAPQSAAPQDGPLLLRVVDDIAQAALKARNDFLAELNAADAQRREVHSAAKARLEAELQQMAASATKLSDRLFFTARGVMNLARACDALQRHFRLHALTRGVRLSQVPQPAPFLLPASAQPAATLPPAATNGSAPAPALRSEPPAAPQASSRPPTALAPSASADEADREVAAVNARPGSSADAITAEVLRLREQNAQARLQERQEVRVRLRRHACARPGTLTHAVRSLRSLRRLLLQPRRSAPRRRCKRCAPPWSERPHRSGRCWRSWRRCRGSTASFSMRSTASRWWAGPFLRRERLLRGAPAAALR
jgi:hypothetical protein